MPHWRCAASFETNLDDLLCVHPWLRASLARFGLWCRRAPRYGRTVIGGMLAASFLAIFLIPVTFNVVEKIPTRGKGEAFRPSS